jgi:hypothetical protein
MVLIRMLIILIKSSISFFFLFSSFWDEHFLFECNDKSNQIHLQIIDRKKPNKKFNPNNSLLIDYLFKFFVLFIS